MGHDPDDVRYDEVARAEAPRGEVVLRRRNANGGPAVLELRVNGVFVMDTRETTTERALAQRALAEVPDPRTVLVGGLGLGFTAHELLADPRVERVDVVEIEDAVIGWMRDGTVPHGPGLLADRRINVVHADVATVVEEAGAAVYDLVLMDVDNGPGYLVHEHNEALYQPGFLVAARRVLQPGGALVVWTADPAPALARALGEVFGHCEQVTHPVLLQGREEEYHLYLARVPSPA
jgi:spermidine synthase